MSNKPVVAIIGRPNVGKSMLFNKLVGRRVAIVEDTPGVTRDRVTAVCEWRGREFTLVDTGGIEGASLWGGGTSKLGNSTSKLGSADMREYIREQARLAIESADAVIFVCDVKTGITESDSEIALMLQKSRLRAGGGRMPVVAAVNKCDRAGAGGGDAGVYEFYGLGLGDPIAVSALHGIGTGDLLDACFEHLPPDTGGEPEADVIRVAVVGKPNAGKSSLTNRLLGEQRVIVSEVPGTTRDAIDSYLENEHGRFVIIDTAGMRKKSRVRESVEYFSVLRAVMAIERADACVILLDARDGVTEQDTKVAGLAHDAGKACVIAVNKWDLIEKNTHTMNNMRERVYSDLPFMPYAPVEFISAKTGARVGGLLGAVATAAANNAMRVTTGMLNDVLADAVARVQPPSDKGRRLKIYYISQVAVKPPRFVAFVNDQKLFHFSYRRYLENRIREAFGFGGTPIALECRVRNRDET